MTAATAMEPRGTVSATAGTAVLYFCHDYAAPNKASVEIII